MPANAVEGAARAIRGAVKRWFTHANATLTSGGAANVHTLTYGTAPSAYVSGDGYVFKAGFTNSGGTTLNVNALGAKAIQFHGTALVGNEIVSGRVAVVYYDGVNFQLVNSQVAGIQTGDAAGGDLSGTYPDPTVTGTHLSAPLPIAQGGSGQVTALAAFNALVATAASVAEPGYIKFENGLILQWGQQSGSGTTSITVTFPLAFPTGIFVAMAITNDSTHPVVSWTASSTTQATFTTDKVTSAALFYFAVGN